jgi:hypothetical protein
MGVGPDDEPSVVPCRRRSAAWRGRCRTKIGGDLQIVGTVKLYTNLTIKAESGDNPLFQLRSHQEHLPRMTDVFKPLYAGQERRREDML